MKNKKTRLVILGGFLGSGKTTLMMKLSAMLRENGDSVAVITNDQGGFLVDTAFSKAMDIPSAEVTAGCFCCNFPDLITNIKTLAEEHSPDYIIAEAVGSCTDLNATVLLPLKQYHGDLVEVASYFVLVDGSRVIGEYQAMDLLNPASPKEVLVAHQIAEATEIVLSKTDFFVDGEMEEALSFVTALNGEASIYPVSVRSGANLQALADRIVSGGTAEVLRTVPLDYEVYARAEAEYGWYNGSWKTGFPEGKDPEALGMEMMEYIGESIDAEIAHGKVLLETGEGSVKISLAGGRIDCDRTGSPVLYGDGDFILNIRAATDPETIVRAVEGLFSLLERRYGMEARSYVYSSLVPAPPNPTHRLEAADARS